MNGDRVLRFVAILTLWVAPLPAAFFVGRSVYWHLVYNWHLDLAWLGIGAAGLTGSMIEIVGILSAHVALALARWNQRGDVKRERGSRERAPLWLAVGCFVLYAGVAIALAVVLEALPKLAVFAPALVTAMAADAYISLGLYEQHRDRLDRYGLQWNWKAQPDEISTVVHTETVKANSKANLQDAQPAPAFAMQTKQEQVAWLHGQQPELQPVELAQMVGCSVSTVSRALASGNHREVDA